MNAPHMSATFGSTSSGVSSSPTVRAGTVALCLLFGNMSMPATASTTYEIDAHTYTTSGPDTQVAVRAADTTADAVMEIRRRSGLTWEELADLFSVTRRSVHHWGSGKTVTAVHEQAIRQTLSAVRQLDRGAASNTRALLLTADAAGVTALSLLKDGRYHEAVSLAGDQPLAATQRQRTPLSQEALEARRPPPPGLLLGAVDEKIALPAKARVARVVGVPKAAG